MSNLNIYFFLFCNHLTFFSNEIDMILMFAKTKWTNVVLEEHFFSRFIFEVHSSHQIFFKTSAGFSIAKYFAAIYKNLCKYVKFFNFNLLNFSV